MIYLIRHGETEWNKIGKLQGIMDSPLTNKGIMEVEEIKNKLKDVKFDKILTSPSGRSVKSGEIIKGEQKILTIILEGLHEINHGEWQGMEIEEIKKKYPEEYFDFMNNHEIYKPVGYGETFHDLEERVRMTFEPIFELGKSENLLVVSHGAVIQMVLMILQGKTLKEFKDIKVPKNAVIIKIAEDLSYEIME